MRRLVAVAVSIGLMLSSAVPASAFTHYGWFLTSAIDTNGNGQADLSVCYGSNTSSPIYTNRAALAQEFTRWNGAQLGAFSDNGVCNGDGSNVLILAANLGPCESTAPIQYSLGLTDDLGNAGYAQIAFWMNAHCYDGFDWQDNDGILDNSSQPQPLPFMKWDTRLA